MKQLLAALLLLAIAPTAGADLKEMIEAAMAAESRPAADRERDANRKPVETLTFFGLEPNQRVLELLPGGGWYTRLLGPVLYDNGKLFVSVGTQGVEQGLIGQPGFDRIEVVPTTGEFRRVERRIEGIAFDAKDMDLVLTFRNLHNFTEIGRLALNEAAFEALKPGGLYGVVDHTRRHMQEDGTEAWRRMDPVLMIKEIQAVGFVFEDFSTLHYTPDDELRYEVGRKTVAGNTDRFTLLFRKPK
jgi:predicted methyltransferase